ncbi:MAG: alpha/beta fold hydrolase [Halioglobus sp.]
MKKIMLSLLAIAVVVGGVSSCALTRDGELKTPSGSGKVNLDAGSFEAFPLPEYAAKHINNDHKSYFVEVEPGIKIHVLEIGSGYPVYMQHGLPTNGFLYRKVAEQLPQDQYRIIMPTMVGLGHSSKVPASQHTLDNHIRWMNDALNQLALNELIFVGHDWGGPVGMGALVRSPDLLEGVVLLNTVLHSPKEAKTLSTPLRVANTAVVGEIVFEVIVSIFDQLPGMQADPESMPPNVIELYERPLLESGNAKGPLALMRMSADSPDHPSAQQVRSIEAYIEKLDIPSEIVWGMNDPILGTRSPAMEALFPKANLTQTEGGHFLQEETPGEIAKAVQRIYQQIKTGEDR